MSEPGWNPASDSFPDYLEGSANLADEAANAPAPADGGPGMPVVDYGQMASLRTGTAEAGVHALSTPPTPPSQGGESVRAHAPSARQVVSVLSAVAHGALVVTWQGIELTRRFPRASLASGLSIAILAAVMVMKPGKGEHDTTTEIKNNPPAKTAQHQPAVSPPASPTSREGGADPDIQKPGVPAPVVATGSKGKANKGESHDNHHDKTEQTLPPLVADNQGPTAPGPEAGRLAPAPAPLAAVEPVKLTGGESEPLLPPVGEPPLSETGSQASQSGTKNAANAPAPAPTPAPVFELASAEVKPGTPPETTTPAPIPAPAPAAATEKESSTSGRAPSITPAPAPAAAPSLSPAVEPSVAPLAPVLEPGPTPEAKKAAGAAVQGASATASATAASESAAGETAKTTMTGSGMALGTGLGAALSALGKAAADKLNKKQEAAVPAADPHVSTAPAETSKTAAELPPASTPASASPSSIESLPPVVNPPPSLPAPKPTEPASNPSRDRTATSALPPVAPAPPTDILDPHPGTAADQPHASTAPKEGSNPNLTPAPESGSGPNSGTVSGAIPAAAAPSNSSSGHGQTHEQTSSQPVSASAESTPREIAQPLPADPAAPPALKPDHQELARLGWAPVKRAGPGMVRDLQREIVDNDDGLGNSDQDKGSAGGTDPSAHADKEQSFEAEPAPFGTRKVGRDAQTGDAASASTTASTPSQAPDKVETVLHKVEKNENFWSIARLYYPSGRYYRALWKYNSAKVPVIDELYVGTILKIPPPEDLDPAYIDPPGSRAPRVGAKNRSVNLTSQDGEATDRRASRTEGVPIRRSSRSDPELNLPVSDPFTEQASDRVSSSHGSGRSGRPSRAVNDDDFPDRGNGKNGDPGTAAEPEVRSRSTVSRPVYKVRRYDTLRTIARDTLGDSHRADEVLELNRDIIDDPGHLIVGQILELPEDARVVRARNGQ